MAKKILVWGVGWLGLPLVKHLQESDFQVCCLTRSADKKALLTSTSFDALTIDELLEGPNYFADCEVFIVTVPPVADSSLFDKLSSLLNNLPNECQVIYTSSTGIYKNFDGLINEKSELDSTSSVYKMEGFLQKNRPQNLTILRLGGLIGPKRHPVHFLAKKSINTNPSQAVNLVQQIDVIKLVSFFTDIKKSGIFNVCSPEHPSRKEYYSRAAQEFGLASLSFENDEHQSGKIVDTKKIAELFPNFTFTSIYDFEKCR
jgi:nucleoside-diphosphate-sugar epimerase